MRWKKYHLCWPKDLCLGKNDSEVRAFLGQRQTGEQSESWWGAGVSAFWWGGRARDKERAQTAWCLPREKILDSFCKENLLWKSPQPLLGSENICCALNWNTILLKLIYPYKQQGFQPTCYTQPFALIQILSLIQIELQMMGGETVKHLHVRNPMTKE